MGGGTPMGPTGSGSSGGGGIGLSGTGGGGAIPPNTDGLVTKAPLGSKFEVCIHTSESSSWVAVRERTQP